MRRLRPWVAIPLALVLYGAGGYFGFVYGRAYHALVHLARHGHCDTITITRHQPSLGKCYVAQFDNLAFTNVLPEDLVADLRVAERLGVKTEIDTSVLTNVVNEFEGFLAGPIRNPGERVAIVYARGRMPFLFDGVPGHAGDSATRLFCNAVGTAEAVLYAILILTMLGAAVVMTGALVVDIRNRTKCTTTKSTLSSEAASSAAPSER